jgi:hypothetical protein
METQSEDEAIARLLRQRFGDGLVYLTDNGDRERLERAKRRGLVADDGYVTPRGFALVHSQEECVS